MNTRFYKYATIGILGSAFALRLLGLDKGIWVDEWSSITVSQSGGFIDTLVNLRNYDHPPLYFMILHLWLQLGKSEVFLRLPSVVMGMGTVYVTMVWLKRYSKLAGILAGVLLCAAPILLRYSQEIRDYPLLVLATSLVFYYASRVATCPEGRSDYIGLGLSLTLAVATHLIGIFLILPVCGFLVGMNPTRRTDHWLKVIPAIAIPIGVFLFEYLFYLKDLNKSGNWWVSPMSFRVISLTGHGLFGLSSLIWPWDIVIHVLSIVLPLFAAALAFGHWRRSMPFLGAALLYWFQIIGYGAFVTPLLNEKFLLPGLIPFLGFLALQTATIERKVVRTAAIVTCAVMSLSFAVSWIDLRAWEPIEPWKEMSRLLESQWPGNALLIFYPDYCGGPVRYYFTRTEGRAALDITPGMCKEQLADSLASRWSALDHRNSASTVFLVMRYDGTASRDSSTLPTILADLKQRAQGALAVTMLSFSSEPSDERLFVTMASILGPPLHVSDIGRFVWAEYGPQGEFPKSGVQHRSH